MEKKDKDESSEESKNEESESLENGKADKKEKKLLNKKRKKEKSKEKEEKNSKKKDDIIVEENKVVFLLDNKRRITIQKFKGQIKVDVREFYEDGNTLKPGKKGISLSLDNWKKLKGFIDDIDESIDNMK